MNSAAMESKSSVRFGWKGNNDQSWCARNSEGHKSEEAESDALLRFLFEHQKRPEVQVRHRWREGDLAFWDNCCLLHYAVADSDTRRVMQRVVLRKIGVPAKQTA